MRKLVINMEDVLPGFSDCSRCLSEFEEGLSRVKGIGSLSVNSAESTISLSYDPDVLTIGQIRRLAREMGFDLGQRIGHASLRVSQLDCPDCARRLEKGISSLEGIIQANANLVTSRLDVEFETAKIGLSHICSAVRNLGSEILPEEPRKAIDWQMVLTALSGLSLFLGAGSHLLGLSHATRVSLLLLAMILGGFYALRSAWYSVLSREIGIDILIILATVGAGILAKWEEGATVIFLFSVGELLESYAVERNRRSIRRLLDMAPKKARIKKMGEEIEIDASGLVPGDVVIVKPGEKIPADGVVSEGTSSVDQSPLTGESIPVEKIPGDVIFAGSINGTGSLEIMVTKSFKDNTLSRIMEIVEEAQTKKSKLSRFVERFARYYTPSVIVLALLIAVLPVLLGGASSVWLYRALVLLVISCPCALVISTPVSIVSGIARGARSGVLIKGGTHLEAMGTIKAIMLDKTGTLTYGRPGITGIIPLEGNTEDEILALAAALESRSEHPLAQAVLELAHQRRLPHLRLKDFTSFPGKGAKGQVDGETFYIGRQELFGKIPEELAKRLERLQDQGKTVLLLGGSENILAILTAEDSIRTEAADAVKNLRKLGIEKVVILTGDNARTARAICRQLGIEDFRAELLPEQKAEEVKRAVEQIGACAMVGDGMNDAPALAASTVGIAMGAAGSDLAIETADVVLLSGDLRKIPFCISLSRKTISVIRQNIVFSLGFKLLFLILAALGVATLWMAVAADMGASLLVILNGMRLLKEPAGSSSAGISLWREAPSRRRAWR